MDKRSELVKLLDIAIRCCQEVRDDAARQSKSWLVEDSAAAEKKFIEIRDQIESNVMQRSHGAGFGITRALSEWAPAKLYDAGAAVEDYFMANF